MNVHQVLEAAFVTISLYFNPTPEPVAAPEPQYVVQLPPVQQEGLASFYGAGEKGMHGKKTATGEKFNPEDHTCASRSLPLNSTVIVEDVLTGNWTYCRVNDRGPYGAKLYDRAGGGWAAMFRRKGGYLIKRRIDGKWQPGEFFKRRPGKYRGVMDMSYGTAKALGVDLDAGLNRVRVRYWDGNPRYGFSPLVRRVPSPTAQCSSKAPICGG